METKWRRIKYNKVTERYFRRKQRKFIKSVWKLGSRTEAVNLFVIDLNKVYGKEELIIDFASGLRVFVSFRHEQIIAGRSYWSVMIAALEPDGKIVDLSAEHDMIARLLVTGSKMILEVDSRSPHHPKVSAPEDGGIIRLNGFGFF